MHLQRSDLWSLEDYSERRAAFRQEVIEHKKTRQVELGPNATLYFEDAMTMKYQVQEMLRVEKIFNAAEIEEELEAYNPLIPDGTNWKATFMLEYTDVEERRAALARLGGIEDTVWVQVDGYDKVFAIANEDMERSTDEKASAVHFLRFELSPAAIEALQQGADLKMGIDHAELACEVEIAPATRTQLIADLASTE